MLKSARHVSRSGALKHNYTFIRQKFHVFFLCIRRDNSLEICILPLWEKKEKGKNQKDFSRFPRSPMGWYVPCTWSSPETFVIPEVLMISRCSLLRNALA
jgi:hypothetical protein